MIKSKLIKNNSGLDAEKVTAGENGIKKERIAYPIPEEDSFMPIDEDSEEIKYQTKKNVF
jgi:hypothetical protein